MVDVEREDCGRGWFTESERLSMSGEAWFIVAGELYVRYVPLLLAVCRGPPTR